MTLLMGINSIKSKIKMAKVSPDEESSQERSSAFNIQGLKSDPGGIFYIYCGKYFQVFF